MKTKPITLILTLLFCLSGSVFAEEEKKVEKISESSKIRFKKLKNRVHRFREVKDLKGIYEEFKSSTNTLDDLVAKIKTLKTIRMDMGKIWAYEDMKKIRSNISKVNKVNVTLEIQKPFDYKVFRFKPIKTYNNLTLIQSSDSRYKNGVTEDLLIHSDKIKLKMGRVYFGYFPETSIVSYYNKSNGVETHHQKWLYVYGDPISEDEYNKKLNTDKDEN
jgi:hypothetical protein